MTRHARSVAVFVVFIVLLLGVLAAILLVALSPPVLPGPVAQPPDRGIGETPTEAAPTAAERDRHDPPAVPAADPTPAVERAEPPQTGPAPPADSVPTVTLVGHVQAADGTPVAAKVRVVGDGEQVDAAAGRTDDDGGFRVQVRLGASVTGGVPVRVTAAPDAATHLMPAGCDVIVVPGADEVDVGTIRLQRAAIVHGAVVGPSGAPVAGAEVGTDDPADSIGDDAGGSRVRTDAAGRFELPGVRAGRVRLRATANGFIGAASDPVDAVLDGSVGPVTIRLRAPVALRFVVAESSARNPIAGAYVGVVDADGTHVAGRTGADGAFDYTFESERVQFRIWANGYLDKQFISRAPRDDTHVSLVILRKGCTLVGTVRGPDGPVDAQNAFGRPTLVRLLSLETGRQHRLSWRECITPAGEFRLSTSMSGRFELLISLPMYAQWRTTVDLTPGTTIALGTVTLVPRGTLVVKFVRPDGEHPGVIRFALLRYRDDAGPPTPVDDTIPEEPATGFDGTAVLYTGLGRYCVRADLPGFAPVSADVTVSSRRQTRVTIRLEVASPTPADPSD
jgi:hypothetical protein